MALSWDEQVMQEIRRLEGRRIKAAAAHGTRRVKELLSVPAPRKTVTAKSGRYAGTRYYRATTPAVDGAPPRKLSGRLRASVTYEISPDGLTARIGSNVIYARRHEFGRHPFLRRALEEARSEIEAILGKPFTISDIHVVKPNS